MTRRERMEARLERRREWAEKRRAKADALRAQDEHLRGDIAFITQPGSDMNRLRAKVNARSDRAHEHSTMANHHEQRADGIERQLDRSIYSDDEDAVERLEERVTALEAERDRIKAYNASCRKGAPDLSLLDEDQKADLASCLRFQPYACKNGAMPGYVLTNLGGNIRRNKERLEALRRES